MTCICQRCRRNPVAKDNGMLCGSCVVSDREADNEPIDHSRDRADAWAGEVSR